MSAIKREIYFMLAGLGIELFALGVGVLISPTTGWVISGIGLVVFVYFVIKAIRIKVAELSSIEMQQERKLRAKYLPNIENLIAELINRVETIAQNDTRLYDLEEYRKEYPIKGWHFKRMMQVDDNISLEGYLWAKKVFYNNLLFKRIVDNDPLVCDITQKLDTLYAKVKDKFVKRFMRGIKKGLHVAYSYVIFNKLSAFNFKSIVLKTSLEYTHGQRVKDRVRDLQNQLSTRIKELLDGAQDVL